MCGLFYQENGFFYKINKSVYIVIDYIVASYNLSKNGKRLGGQA